MAVNSSPLCRCGLCSRPTAELREIAEPVIKEVFSVKFGEVLDVAMLSRLMPILTDDAAMRLAARAYKVGSLALCNWRLLTGGVGSREQHRP